MTKNIQDSHGSDRNLEIQQVKSIGQEPSEGSQWSYTCMHRATIQHRKIKTRCELVTFSPLISNLRTSNLLQSEATHTSSKYMTKNRKVSHGSDQNLEIQQVKSTGQETSECSQWAYTCMHRARTQHRKIKTRCELVTFFPLISNLRTSNLLQSEATHTISKCTTKNIQDSHGSDRNLEIQQVKSIGQEPSEGSQWAYTCMRRARIQHRTIKT